MFIRLGILLTIVSLSKSEINSIVQIKISEKYCSQALCHGMHFPSAQEVASFEPQTDNDNNNNYQQTTSSPSLLFKDSDFFNFPLNLFLAFTNLTELDMRNCSISHITWMNFLWATNLKVLFLSNNSLTRIDELTFSYALNLQFLWLDNNQIRNLVSESFKGLTQLKYLSMSGNRIMFLPDGLFDDQRNLEVIILSDNKIKHIQNNLFTKCPNLLTIDLQDNRIHNISEYAFKDLKHIMNLDISRNKPLRSLILNIDVPHFYAESCSLRQINIYGRMHVAHLNANKILELYFSQPESLMILELRNNSLQQIASLSRATNLTHLNLSHNPKLEALPDPWGVKSLKKLDLSNTGLKEFPETILGPKGTHLRLYWLDISNNSIRQIDPMLLNRLENITNFYFNANDWNCFDLQLLMDLLIKPKNIAYSKDEVDSFFPGQYIGGIKCMYRNVEDENDDIVPQKKKQPSSSSEQVDELRNELKTIVRFYEDKFAKVMENLDDLKRRLDILTAENATVWQHITLTT